MYLNEMTLQMEIPTLITPLSNNEIMLHNKLKRHRGYKLAFSPVRQLRFISTKEQGDDKFVGTPLSVFNSKDRS